MRQDAMQCKDRRNKYALLLWMAMGGRSSGGEVATAEPQ